MITYKIPVYVGRENGDCGLLIKCHDPGVQMAVKLLRFKQVSRWREVPEPYKIPDGATAKFCVKRADKARTVTTAYIEESGDVRCPVHPYSVATPGICNAEVVLYDKDGKWLTSATFTFRVDEKCVPLDGENAPVYVDSIQGLMSTAEDAAKRAEEAAAAAEAARGEVDPELVKEAVTEYLVENPPQQFETDETLTLKDGILSVNTTDQMEQDNTLPMTSAGVYATVGNIEALLKTI